MDGDCWIWSLSCNNHGAPMIAVARSAKTVRRVVAELTGFQIKPGYVFATPFCDARCVNPEHARYVTKKQSMVGANISRGKAHSLATAPHARSRSGLTWEKVREIRKRYQECGNSAQVAREFGLKHTNTHKICRHRTWKESDPFWI